MQSLVLRRPHLFCTSRHDWPSHGGPNELFMIPGAGSYTNASGLVAALAHVHLSTTC